MAFAESLAKRPNSMQTSGTPDAIPPKKPDKDSFIPDDLKDKYPRWAVDKVISSLGSATAKVIESRMKKQGVFTDSQYVQTSDFYQELYQMIGRGAKVFLEELRKYRS